MTKFVPMLEEILPGRDADGTKAPRQQSGKAAKVKPKQGPELSPEELAKRQRLNEIQRLLNEKRRQLEALTRKHAERETAEAVLDDMSLKSGVRSQIADVIVAAAVAEGPDEAKRIFKNPQRVRSAIKDYVDSWVSWYIESGLRPERAEEILSKRLRESREQYRAKARQRDRADRFGNIYEQFQLLLWGAQVVSPHLRAVLTAARVAGKLAVRTSSRSLDRLKDEIRDLEREQRNLEKSLYPVRSDGFGGFGGGRFGGGGAGGGGSF